MILDKTDVHEREEPYLRWSTGIVEEVDDFGLCILPSSFSKVLVSLVRFALPVVDHEGTEDLLDSSRDLCLGVVTDQSVHGSETSYLVH